MIHAVERPAYVEKGYHGCAMTRRYHLEASSEAIAEILNADRGPDPWAGGPLSVGEFAPVVTLSQRTGRRVIRPMVWGYPAPGPNGIGTTGEVRWVPTVRNIDSPFWIGNLRHSELRCLVPATSFFASGSKRSLAFSPCDLPLFAMAGIWRDLTDMPVFAIVSSDASNEAKAMGASSTPVILDPVQQDRWLIADWKDASLLVAPYAGAMTRCA